MGLIIVIITNVIHTREGIYMYTYIHTFIGLHYWNKNIVLLLSTCKEYTHEEYIKGRPSGAFVVNPL